MSFDWSRDQFLIGTFDKTEARDLQWYTTPDDATSEIREGPFYEKMQGAGSHKGNLWISTSWSKNPSTLYYGKVTPGSTRLDLSRFRSKRYPPGLEDIHVSKSSGNIWTLTEFAPSRLVVFAVKRWKLTV